MLNKFLILLSVALFQGCQAFDIPCPMTIDIDTRCRVTDIKDNQEAVVETYQLDEYGQEKLYIWKKGKSRIQIEHPLRKVKSYEDNINQMKAEQNRIEFDDSDSTMLIVNGQKFPISEVK